MPGPARGSGYGRSGGGGGDLPLGPPEPDPEHRYNDYKYIDKYVRRFESQANKIRLASPIYVEPESLNQDVTETTMTDSPFDRTMDTFTGDSNTTEDTFTDDYTTTEDTFTDDYPTNEDTFTGDYTTTEETDDDTITDGASMISVISSTGAFSSWTKGNRPVLASPIISELLAKVTVDESPTRLEPGYHRFVEQMREDTGSLRCQGQAPRPDIVIANKNKANHNLPILGYKQKILNGIASNQCIVIEGFTGCGKTTQVPQFILDDCISKNTECNIVVTQPRRMAAISVAKRVSKERGWAVGDVVAYKVGLGSSSRTETTRIIYVTTGVLLQQLITKKTLRDYTHIIIDEVHERDLDTDLLLAFIRILLVETRDTKTRIIIMSATISTEKFANYFFDLLNRPEGKKGIEESKVIKIKPNNTYQTHQFYLEEIITKFPGDVWELVTETMNFDANEPIFHETFFPAVPHMIKTLVKNIEEPYSSHFFPNFKPGMPVPKPGPGGGVLIFLPGLLEITTLQNLLNDCNEPNWIVLPIHSSIENDEQAKVFDPVPSGYRKIILATNIAESSITVPDISYVMDFCLTKNNTTDYHTKFTSLKLEWSSKQQSTQRKGRVGRVRNGFLFRMVPFDFYKKLHTESTPEMRRASLEKVVLEAKLIELGSPPKILALTLDPPPLSGIGSSVKNLKEVGALSITVGSEYKEYDGDVTILGKMIAELPIDIRCARLVFLGYVFGVMDQAIAIASSITVNTPFSISPDSKYSSYVNKLKYAGHSFSDSFAVLELYKEFLSVHLDRNGDKEAMKTWAVSQYADLNVLSEMRLIHHELVRRLDGKFKIVTDTSKFIKYDMTPQDVFFLKFVIAGAFYPNYYPSKKDEHLDYKKEIYRALGDKCTDPLHMVYFKDVPQSSRYPETNKLYGNQIIDYFFDTLIGLEAKQPRSLIPLVKIDGTRCYITFDPRGGSLGRISPFVYRAVKLRQLQNEFHLITQNSILAKRVLDSEEGAFQTTEVSGIDVPRSCPLPDTAVQAVQAKVTEVISPSKFWVVYGSIVYALSELQSKLMSLAKTYEEVPIDEIYVGKLYIVWCPKEKMFCRGRVDFINRRFEMVMVYDVDTGKGGWRRSRYVFYFTEELKAVGAHTFPCMAIPCRIWGIDGPQIHGRIWEPQTIDKFKSMVQRDPEHTVRIFIKGIHLGVMGVDFEYTEPPHMRDILLNRKLASEIEETPSFLDMAEGRFQIRTGVKTREDNDGRYFIAGVECGETGEPLSIREYLSPDPVQNAKSTKKKIKLKGPFSPLEMSFRGHIQHLTGSLITIDYASVNSVPLDPDPFSPINSIIVAATTTLSRKKNILLRETTMLPPSPGLLGLLTMTFCPVLQLHHYANPLNGLKYTGVLTGLGYDPVTKSSIYPNHDTEMVFDVKFAEADIEHINRIRKEMNIALRACKDKVADGDPIDKEERIARIRSSVMDLVQRQRCLIPEEERTFHPNTPFTWGSEPEYDKEFFGRADLKEKAVVEKLPDPFLCHKTSPVFAKGKGYSPCDTKIPDERIKDY